MLKKVEISLSSKVFYPRTDILRINQMATTHSLQAINLFGGYCEDLHLINDLAKTYVHIDFPYATNSSDARYILANVYYKQYSQYIKGMNFGAMANWIDEQRWELVETDLIRLAKFCSDNQLDSRFVLDLSCYTTYENIIRTANIAEQAGMGSILVGSSAKAPINDLIIDSHKLTKNVSIPVGFFATKIQPADLESLKQSNFVSILLSPNNILDILLK